MLNVILMSYVELLLVVCQLYAANKGKLLIVGLARMK